MSFLAVPGTRIGDYVVISEIGRGGMSTVYLAEHAGLGRKVALKILASELAEDEEFRTRFIRESKVAASLDHPNVVPIYDAGEAEGLLYISMRYVDGIDLQTLIVREEYLEPERALSIIAQVGAALGAAHTKGLIHRDVKPANIILARGVGPKGADHAYLADFGLARTEIAGTSLTKAGAIYGTFDYIAPEQIEGRPLDARTDVYSLGCVLYQCLVGEVPFPVSSLAKLDAHLRTRPPQPSEKRPELEVGLDAVVAKALAKDKDDRYVSAAELVAAIEVVEPQIADAQTEPSSMPGELRAKVESTGMLSVGAELVGEERTQRAGDPGTRTNVPVSLTTFVGRGRELSDLRHLFAAERLITLVGPAGCGKTRLALEFARGLGEGSDVWHIDVGASDEAFNLIPTAAALLGVGGSQDDLAALIAYLQSHSAVIILDNCDALVDTCAGLGARLLSACPDLHVLATSREPLSIPGETTLPILPLSVPRGGRAWPDAIAPIDSVKLFLERAMAAEPTFRLTDENASSVAEICRGLDGLPLGLELAAAWVRSLSPGEIVERFVRPGGVLASTLRTAAAHHRTLGEAIDLSFRLLSPEERLLITRLTVFDGGFGLDAAESIGSDEHLGRAQILPLLSNLVAKSLVLADRSGGLSRFRLLEPIRRHAGELLADSGEGSVLHQRHAQYFIGLVSEHEGLAVETDEGRWIDNLRSELPNLRKALRAAVNAPPDAPFGGSDDRAAVGHIAFQLAEWDLVVDSLSPVAESGETRILKELGTALTKRSKDRASPDFISGQRLLERLATTGVSDDPDAVVILASTWKGTDDEHARVLYRQALELDPADSYALVNLLECEMALGRDRSIIQELTPTIETAVLRCREQIHERVNEPWAAYDLGKLELLLGRADEGLAAHLLATHQSNSSFMIETSLRSLDRLNGYISVLGHEEARRLMILSLRARFPDYPVERVLVAHPATTTLSVPLLVLAGSSNLEEAEALTDLRPLLSDALGGESWTIISGGTTQGVSALAGELAAAKNLQAIGYVPAAMPVDVAVNERYAEIRETQGTDFSLREALCYWADLLTSGIEPSDVCFLAIGGGSISALEYQLALSLGATVGVVLETGGAADKLLEDPWWRGVGRIASLDLHSSALRDFCRRFERR